MTTAAQLATCPKITSPTKHADFTRPFTVRWDPQGTEVKRYWLCVGTKEGDWDVFSGNVGESLRHAIDVSDRTEKVLYILLMCAVDDPDRGMERTFDADLVMVEAV